MNGLLKDHYSLTVLKVSSLLSLLAKKKKKRPVIHLLAVSSKLFSLIVRSSLPWIQHMMAWNTSDPHFPEFAFLCVSYEGGPPGRLLGQLEGRREAAAIFWLIHILADLLIHPIGMKQQQSPQLLNLSPGSSFSLSNS